MRIIPDNEAYIIKAPLSVDEAHQMDFANATAQENYFKSLPNIAFMKITYNRENGTLYFPRNIEEIRSYNYLMYKNKNYGNKWFYAFITNMRYENNDTTAIDFVTDVFQTYMFDYEWRNSFIERETVDDDTVGKHLFPETLEYGDYICNGSQTKEIVRYTPNATNDYTPMVVMQTSERLGVPVNDVNESRVVGGVPQGSWFYAWYLTESNYNTIVSGVLKNLDTMGKSNAVMNMFLVPNQVATWQQARINQYDKDGNLSGVFFDCWLPTNTTNAKYVFTNYEVARPDTIDGYTPKNNKCKVFPYQYFLATNNGGSAINFNYEDFDGTPKFQCAGVLSLMNPTRLYPNNSLKSHYNNGELDGIPESISGCPLPVLSWESDFYLNWIAQNGEQIAMEAENLFVHSVADTASSMVGSALSTGSIGVGVLEGVTGLIGTSNTIDEFVEQKQVQITQAKAVPNTVRGNANIGDLAYSLGSANFRFIKYSVRREYIERIDEYFSKFGYRVNEHKIPNLKSRANWNYIKTVGANLFPTNIPQEALQELKNIYNNGVTIWHNPSNFLDYSQNNGII